MLKERCWWGSFRGQSTVNRRQRRIRNEWLFFCRPQTENCRLIFAPVAQLDRALGCGPEGRRFKSSQAYQERSHSGRVRALGKRVIRKDSWVQIPPSPPAFAKVTDASKLWRRSASAGKARRNAGKAVLRSFLVLRSIGEGGSEGP